MEVREEEVIDVMVSGGKKIVEEAISDWRKGKYLGSDDEIQENVRRWQMIGQRINEIGQELKYK